MEKNEKAVQQYENTCTCTLKLYREVGSTMSKNINILYALCAAAGIATLILAFMKKLLIGEIFAAIAVLLLIFVNWVPYQWAKKRFAQEQAEFGEPVQLHSVFGAQEIIVSVVQNGKTQTICYDQVEKLKRLDHAYVLIMRDGQFLLLDREGFTKGDASGFLQFIKEKCEKL